MSSTVLRWKPKISASHKQIYSLYSEIYTDQEQKDQTSLATKQNKYKITINQHQDIFYKAVCAKCKQDNNICHSEPC